MRDRASLYERVILVDSSVWVEYDRATGSRSHLRLRELIATERPVAVTEPIVMEVLAGARDARREGQLRQLLSRFELLRFDVASDFDGAVTIYRRCRAAGVTPRGLIDCLIVAVAWRRGASVLAHDADLSRVTRVMTVELDEGSL